MKITLSHAAFEADFKAFLDGELPTWRRLQLRRHLKNCPACRKEIREMQLIETELKEETAPLGGDLRAKILESAPSPATAPTAPDLPKLAPQTRRREAKRLIFGFGGLATLAALMTVSQINGCGGGGGGGFGSNAAPVSASVDFAAKMQQQMPAQSEPMVGAASSAGSSASPSLRAAERRRTGNVLSADGHLKYPNDATDSWSRSMEGNFGNVVPAQRQVHKQGSLSVTVDDAEAKGSATEILVKNVGGFVAQNALSTGAGGRKTATLDVRVPVAQFESIVAKIGKLGVVREKSVNGEDITQRVVVAGTRQQSLSRELSIREAQLRAVDSKKVAERRSIVADVRSLRFQANQARAQLEYLKKYAALATLFVTLQDKPKAAPVVGATGEFGQTARAAWSSFLLSARLPLQLLIWIAAYAPLWIPALLVWRKFGRKWMNAA